ncbi:MAG: SirB1 family protein [Burkholderiales bacterium]
MMATLAPTDHWQRIVAAPDAEMDLARAALVIAAAEYPDLDIDAYLDRIDDMAARLGRRLRGDIPPTETIIALNHYLFEELGFAGNDTDYYDPRNSYLNEVLDRRLGIPITLSLVYIEIGRRVGLELYGISFPGHFLVGCMVRGGALVLDPYARGISLGVEDLQQRIRQLRNGIELDPQAVKSMISAAGNKEIVVRLLRNLKEIYLHENEMMKALSAAGRIIDVAPDAAEEYRDRGRIYLDLECFRAALADFSRYLLLKPGAADAAAIVKHVAALRQIASRLN